MYMNRKLLKDALFGAIGGVAGTYVLGKTVRLLSRFQSNRDKWIERELVREEPTAALTRRVAKTAWGKDLGQDQAKQLGNAVHWGYGIFFGSLYGVLRNRLPAMSTGAGLPFGVALDVFGEGMLLPIFKLSPPATQFPVSTHLRDMTAHYAYTATAECVCATLSAVTEPKRRTERGLRTKRELREVS
jgi:putative membrane protein